MKDMTGDDPFLRASAIRALCSITDSTMLSGVERYLRQAIVDKNSAVSSAALVSAVKFMSINPEIVKRWLNEISELCKNDAAFTQYHALGLFYYIKQHDKLALSKMILRFAKSQMRVVPAVLLCIRMSVEIMIEVPDHPDTQALLTFIESCIHNRSEIVVFEACRGLISIPKISLKYVVQVVSVMRVFMTSAKTIVKFVAAHTLCTVASVYPVLISECSIELETLLSDPNKGIATFAIMTLLKIGEESNIERVIVIISSYIAEIDENLRIIIVNELKILLTKFSSKASVFLTFIASLLKEEGGLGYKQSLVELIVTIIETNLTLKEQGLLLLCEFIEDCEHSQLVLTVLDVLGTQGPLCSKPSQFIRYIYNRIMLESAEIRAASLECLYRFASTVKCVRSSILVLIKRSFLDGDDEVRDRACFYHTLLQNESLEVNEAVDIQPELWLAALQDYIKNGDHLTAFSVDIVASFKFAQDSAAPQEEAKVVGTIVKAPPKVVDKLQHSDLQTILERVKSDKLNRFSHVTAVEQLTEYDCEFRVIYFKHVFADVVVFEYVITNTLDDKCLSQVQVLLETNGDFVVVKSVECELIEANSVGRCYCLVEFSANPTIIAESFPTSMLYSLCDVDFVAGDGIQDEYKIDNTELTVADHFKMTQISDFNSCWDTIAEEFEAEETCALDNYSSLVEAVDLIQKLSGMSVCNPDFNVTKKTRAYRLLLAGQYRNGLSVMAKVELKLTPPKSIMLRMIVRCEDPNITENLFSVLS